MVQTDADRWQAWLYGNWLADAARGLGVPVVASRPWDSLTERVRAAIGLAV